MTTLLAELDALPDLRWVRLSVTVGNDAAQRLYESLGFSIYGEEPEALLIEGVAYANGIWSERSTLMLVPDQHHKDATTP